MSEIIRRAQAIAKERGFDTMESYYEHLQALGKIQ